MGGKGASLGKLVKAGFPVPSGFVIMTYAYEEFLHANGLQVEIEKITESLGADVDPGGMLYYVQSICGR